MIVSDVLDGPVPMQAVDAGSIWSRSPGVVAERDAGACVIYTTHYMEEAERLCDSLAIIDHGKIIARGTVAELKSQLDARDALQLSGHLPPEVIDAAMDACRRFSRPLATRVAMFRKPTCEARIWRHYSCS